MGLASEFGGFELAEAGGMSVLGTGEGTLMGAAGAGELGTMGLMGPAAAVARCPRADPPAAGGHRGKSAGHFVP